MFDSHMPCRFPAMPRICRSESDLSRPQQVRGMGTAWYVLISIGRLETAFGRPTRFGTVGEWQVRGRGTAWYVN
jgi:hypothetical protein